MKRIKFLYMGLAVLALAGCTKLDQKLQSTILFTPGGSSGNTAALLNGTYNDFNGLIHGVTGLLTLQSNSTDESLVPTRGGDWDDGGNWRVLHAHTWNANSRDIVGNFNDLGKAESDALSTLASGGTAQQQDEALFLLTYCQFLFLDLYGQVPYRSVADYNSIDPAPVMKGAAAVDTLVARLNGIITRNVLPNTNPGRASMDAVKFLLMKVLLNKGAFINRATPTFADADMQQVVTIGNQLITSGRYSLNTNYFNNFGPNNGTTSTEAIWAWPNNGSANNGGISAGGTNQRWMNTLHYNSWNDPGAIGGAGWNGFCTLGDFYNMFEGHGDGTPNTVIDTTKDRRLGGKYFAGVTDISGLRPGLLAGQQKNANGTNQLDRQGNPLTFMPQCQLIETDINLLERTGIRVLKYPPDYSNYSGGNQRNQFQIFRYADVVLMVAEAKLRQATPDAAGALALVNALRVIRGATAWATVTLVNTSNVSDPNTLLAERGRELYYENWRRQDLIRFGVFLKPWGLKPTDDPKNLVFPIPTSQIIANPNLTQNPGY